MSVLGREWYWTLPLIKVHHKLSEYIQERLDQSSYIIILKVWVFIFYRDESVLDPLSVGHIDIFPYQIYQVSDQAWWWYARQTRFQGFVYVCNSSVYCLALFLCSLAFLHIVFYWIIFYHFTFFYPVSTYKRQTVAVVINNKHCILTNITAIER